MRIEVEVPGMSIEDLSVTIEEDSVIARMVFLFGHRFFIRKVRPRAALKTRYVVRHYQVLY